MKILLMLLMVVLIVVTAGTHLYFVWKKKDMKTLIVQVGILIVAILAVFCVIYDFNEPSISSLLNKLSPLE